MTTVGGVVGRALASLGGPQTAVLLVVGGVIAGALGGGAMASGVFSGPSATSAGELQVYPCPDIGPALASVKSGQKVLVTGRSEDGTWLRIHLPEPGRTEGWVQTKPLTLSQSISSVPVATCAPEIAAAAASFPPGATLTAIQNNSPSPSPTPVPTATPTPSPSPSPTPTAKPTVRPTVKPTAKPTAPPTAPPTKTPTPTIAPTPTPTPPPMPVLKLAIPSPQTIANSASSLFACRSTTITFSVTATNSASITAVTLYWTNMTTTVVSHRAMIAVRGGWMLQLDGIKDGLAVASYYPTYAIATYGSGLTSSQSNSQRWFVVQCQ